MLTMVRPWGFGLVACVVLVAACGDSGEQNAGGGGDTDPELLFNLPPPEPGSEQYLRLCARYGLGRASRVAVSPDGSQLALGGADLVLSFAATDGSVVDRYPVEGVVDSVEFSPDGAEVVVSAAGLVTRFEAAGGVERATLDKPSENVSVPLAVRYSPTGGSLAVADVQRVRLHPLPATESARDVDGDFAWSSDRIAFAPDGTSLFARTREGVARIDPANGAMTNPYVLATDFDGAVAAGANGLVAAGDQMGNVLVWQGSNTGPLLQATLTGHVDSMAFSPDGALVAASSADMEADLHVWEVATGVERVRQQLSVFLGELSSGMSVRFAPTGDVVFANDGYRLRGFRLSDGQDSVSYGWGHAGWFEDAAISPDSRLVVSSARDQVIVWNRADESVVSTLQPPGISGQVAFSPDSQKLYSTVQGTVFEWDPTSGMLLRQSAELHRSLITELAVSPDGTRLLAGIMANAYMMISAETLEPLFEIAVPDSFASVGAFSPDSSAFVGASSRDALAVWDATTGAELESAAVDPDFGAVLFSGDGSRVVAAARYDVHVYGWPGLTPLHTLTRHEAQIFKLLAIGDRYVMSFGGDNRRVVLWDVLAGRAVSEGEVDDSGVPRIALPEGLNVSLLTPRSGALRTYCNDSVEPPIYSGTIQ